jgi:N-acetylglucosamine repressor
MRQANQTKVVQYIRNHGPIARVDLQKNLCLSWGTITSICKGLLNRGIIQETGSVSIEYGRHPIQLDLDLHRNYVIGLRLGSHLVQSTLLNVKGQVVDEYDSPVDLLASREEILDCLLATARALLARMSLSVSDVAGIGVASPGAVDFQSGIVHYAPRHPNWRDVHLKDSFQNTFQVPCFVDHTSHCFALSEKLFGYGVDKECFIGILLGSGVSAGIVVNGEVYRGADFFAGEFGHICIDHEGPPCACGNNGCLEVFVSGPAIAKMVSSILEHGETRYRGSADRFSVKGIDIDTVIEAAKEGDDLAQTVFSTMGRFLGVGVANLITLFNPECIILGGALTRASDYFLPSLKSTVKSRAWRASRQNIVVSKLPRGAVIGAASLALEHLFSSGLILSRSACYPRES